MTTERFQGNILKCLKTRNRQTKSSKDVRTLQWKVRFCRKDDLQRSSRSLENYSSSVWLFPYLKVERQKNKDAFLLSCCLKGGSFPIPIVWNYNQCIWGTTEMWQNRAQVNQVGHCWCVNRLIPEFSEVQGVSCTRVCPPCSFEVHNYYRNHVVSII